MWKTGLDPRNGLYFQGVTWGRPGREFRLRSSCSSSTFVRTKLLSQPKRSKILSIAHLLRINGPVEIIDGSSTDPLKLHQRFKSWFASSLKSRLQYLGPYPGLPSIGDDPPSNLTLDPSAPPVDAFCLLVLDRDQVDCLKLKSNTRLAFTAFDNETGEKRCRHIRDVNFLVKIILIPIM
ncbi:hypothetical protein Droror1_Dr00003845 [Drosera rotundifolia]